MVSGNVHSEGIRQNNQKRQLGSLKKSVVFLGKIQKDGKPNIFATGSLVYIGETYHLLTAKHVVINPSTGKEQDEDLLAFFNLKGGGVAVRSISEIKSKYGLKWIFHSDPSVDIALIPFLVDIKEDDVLVIPDNIFLGADQLSELYDVFFISYQPGIEPKGKISPIVRGGIISLMKDDETFYIDASAFPGNTGSPVFLKPWPIDAYDKEGLMLSKELGGKFVGIIGEYIPHRELAISAQTGRPRIMFEENTGLSRVWSVSYITEITRMEPFRAQVEKLKANEKKY